MAGLGPNEALIDAAGSRARLSTPALVLDLDRFEANVATMAAWAKDAGVNLRPHAKMHKTPQVAEAQIAAGAVGICCATVGEAEVMVAAGIPDVLITSPAVAPGKPERVAALNRAARRLAVVADHPENVATLAAANASGDRPLTVYLEVDVGSARTGVTEAPAGVAVVEAIRRHDSLRFGGVQAYAGYLQHMPDYDERRAELERAMAPLRDVLAALAEIGVRPEVVTGGGSGSHRMDPEMGLLTELQVGSYCVMDVDYDRIDFVGGGGAPPYLPALFVQATAINVNHGDTAIVDAGLKVFATDGPLPRFADGAPVGATFRFKGDEHGAVVYGDANERLALGDTVLIEAPHCDPTVNLHDFLHCVRGDLLVDIWPIAARGTSV